MKMQWIECNACGADSFQSLSKMGDWNIGKCTKCGLIYLNPAPFFEPTSEFSNISKGFQYTRYMHEKITHTIFEYERAQLKKQQSVIAGLTGQTFTSINYLEVGCGSGASVKAATDLGWQATGFDLDPELINEGIEQHGADLRCTPLLQGGFEADKYHYVRLRDVIEHLPNPYDSLVEIKRILRPGGISLIVAPNEKALINQIRYLLGFKKKMVAYAEPPHHIHGFTPDTLRRILERAGFKILAMKTTTPVDSEYVTSNNMRSASRPDLVAIWKAARIFGMGNFVVAWVQKP
ncbi:MAG: class I SAM-dependent methyltransferase [Bacteroidetes bacterium]|nr:class I SAM-dependent methyltransferase [Bacteroidota bacterium]